MPTLAWACKLRGRREYSVILSEVSMVNAVEESRSSWHGRSFGYAQDDSIAGELRVRSAGAMRDVPLFKCNKKLRTGGASFHDESGMVSGKLACVP